MLTHGNVAKHFIEAIKIHVSLIILKVHQLSKWNLIAKTIMNVYKIHPFICAHIPGGYTRLEKKNIKIRKC